MTETRKLAAILCSDVVGYSRLAGADEDRTLSRLRGLRSDLIDPAIAAHRGRVVKRTGDGAIVEFRSVVDAVRLAIEVQNAMVERNVGVPEDRRIVFRIGIHIGDVVEESDGDLMGDGVNIAARLEGIAEPGAICLSEDAYRQVKGRLDLAVTDLGATRLKNIAEPIRAYSLQVGVPARAERATGAAPSASAKPAPPSKRSPLALAVIALLIIIAAGGGYFLHAGRFAPIASKPRPEAAHLSIVVLPFANLSGDASQDYFADGVTESLTTDLSRIRNSFVIARNTAFAFKGKAIDAREIGKELGVRYVLEGSVQRDSGRLRVNVQLIDADTGSHLWAERFDKPVADLLTIQDEIVARLANVLESDLIAAEAERAQRTSNPDAMDLVFQGRALLIKEGSGTREPLMRAMGYFERALALDPDNVGALCGTALVNIFMASGYLTDDRAGSFAAAETAATKALSLAPNDVWCHSDLGYAFMFTNRAEQGIAELEKSLSLNPNLADDYASIGLAKIYSGHAEETEAYIQQATRLSPRDAWAYSWYSYIGIAKLLLGADEEAAEWFERSVEANRNLSYTHFYFAAALAHLGKLDQARSEARAGLALNPTFTIHRYRLGASTDNPVYLKQRDRVYDGMREAGVPEE